MSDVENMVVPSLEAFKMRLAMYLLGVVFSTADLALHMQWGTADT